MTKKKHKDAVCWKCAVDMGYYPVKKVVIVKQGKCDFCGNKKSLTSLSNDWFKKEK